MPARDAFLGIDFGTTGCRACVIDIDGAVLAECLLPLPAPMRQPPYSEQDAELWWTTLCALLDETATLCDMSTISALAIDGTSSTLLLTDAQGRPLGPALMYDDARSVDHARHIAKVAPAQSGAHGASSSLAKLLTLQHWPEAQHAAHALHQADWLAGRLCGRYGITDENNALKLGYDPQSRSWPDWHDRIGFEQQWLPWVVAPGTPIGTVPIEPMQRFGFAARTLVAAGTTDSTAACLAAGVKRFGDAVTSLGSTLVMKVIARQPVFVPACGVYSHRLGDLWLAGGASNSGGAVLREYFTQGEIDALTARLRPDAPTGLNYYPLRGIGERFPVNDPTLAPALTPRPDDDATFFQGILEGMARIEAEAYRLLAAHGAPYPTHVLSSGGGARNAPWCEIRARALGVPVGLAAHTDAAYGAALLARHHREPAFPDRASRGQAA
jgi:sugar (pentulose or hexulose) kinase